MRPAILGSPAARRKALTVALLVQPNRLLHAEAQARGWRLLYLEYCNYAVPPGLRLDGALLPGGPLADPRIRKILKRTRAAVRLGRAPAPTDRRIPPILSDQAAEGRLAAEHFAERGFRHVGYVGSLPLQEARLLFEGFRDRAAELKMACHLFGIALGGINPSSNSNVFSKQKMFSDWLRAIPKPVGLLAPNDFRAARYALWAAEAGFDVPSEVALLGRGNQAEICESVMPTLSSIDINVAGRIQTACDLLARLMAGEPPPRRPIVVPPTGVVERESTHLLAVPDPTVARALRFLWDHLDLDFSVDDVASAAGVSRRKLERAFRRHLQRGVNEELRRKRLEEFGRLLLATDRSVADLASAVGFRNLGPFYKAFRALHGMTPRKYRKLNAKRRPPNGA